MNKNVKFISIEDSRYKKNEKAYKYAMEMTFHEMSQAIEGFFHNMNSLQSRGGGQLPFSSINYGTCTLPEGRAITKALIEGSIKGTGKYHRTAIFPCCIFQYSKEIHGTKDNPGPNYDLFRLALKSTTQRDYPNYCNVDWSTNLKGNIFDREQKNRALKDLLNFSQSTYCAFAKWLSEHPDYEDYLSLEGYHDCIGDHWEIKVKPAEKFTRYEVMSTMGKRNTTAHLKPLEPCLMGVTA